MASKKQLRRRQREQQQSSKKRKTNPALVFMIGIAAAIVVFGLAAFFLVDSPEPPWPGAVWSAEHGHWH
jgi:hypothetical protein